MNYIKPFFENLRESEEPQLDKEFVEYLEDLKYQSYQSFMNTLQQKKSEVDFMTKLRKLSIDMNQTPTEFGKVELINLEARTLIPTQSQIGLDESLAWLQNIPAIEDIIIKNSASLFSNNRVFVANKKWVLDGNHRFAFVRMLNRNATIPCINVNIPEQSVNNIIKDIQLSLLCTYGDIYTKDSIIKTNISLMKDDDIINYIDSILQGDELEELRLNYAQVDFKKQLANLLIPKSILKEDFDPNENDYPSLVRGTNIPIVMDEEDDEENIEEDEDIKEMEETDNDKSPLNYAGDILGILDPTGAVDILNGLSYLYQGHVFSAICSFASALPGVDFFAKPAAEFAFQVGKGVAVSKTYAKSMSIFGKYLKNFDAKKAAKYWTKMEKNAYKKNNLGQFTDPKLATKMDEMNKTLQVLANSSNKITQILGNVMKKIGDNWLKFKLFYYIWGKKYIQFFQNLVNEIANWKENLKEWMSHVSKEDVVSIIASNAMSIKNDIIDNNVDKQNNNYKNGIHPYQIAIKVRKNPTEGDFKGVPVKFLEQLPIILNNLRGSEVEDLEAQIQSYREYDPEKQELFSKSQTQKEIPPAITPQTQKETPINPTITPKSQGPQQTISNPKIKTEIQTKKPVIPVKPVESDTTKKNTIKRVAEF